MALTSIYHESLTTGCGIHIPYSFEYTSRTTREADISFDSTDIGKLARQTDNNSLWMLIAISPITWSAITAETGAPGDMFKYIYDTNNDGIVDNSHQLEGHNSTFFTSTGH